MRPGVLVLLVLLIPIGAFAGIVPATEHAVSKLTYGEAAGVQLQPVLAAAGTDVLAAWVDATVGRNGIWDSVIAGPNTFAPNPPRHIWSGNASNVSLCWTGWTYFAAWRNDDTVMFAILSRDGDVVVAPRVIRTGAVVYSGALAWDGRRAMLLYDDDASGPEAMVLDADGNVLTKDLPIAPRGTRHSNVVAAGRTFALFLVDESNLRAQVLRITDDGVVDLHPTPVASYMTKSGMGWLAAASDGASHVALAFGDLGTNQQPYVRTVVVDVATLAPQQLPDAAGSDIRSLGLLYIGGRFVIVWNSMSLLVTFPPDAANRTITYTPPWQLQDVVAVWNGTNIIYAWDAAPADVSALFADADGNASGSPFPLSTAVTSQYAVAVAPGLVAWVDATRDGANGNLFASRIDAAGAPIGDPIQLTTTGYVNPYLNVKIVFTGSIWYVLWQESASSSYATWARRIGLDGTLLDVLPMKLPDPVDVAFNGTLLLVVHPLNNDLVADRYTSHGDAIDTITILPGQHHGVTMTSNGDGFLMVWTVGSDWWQFPSPDMLDVYAARLDSLGNLLDVQPIAVATGPDDQRLAAVASSGRDYLVAWVVPGTDSNGPTARLQAQRVDANGTLDGAATTIGPLNATATGLALAGGTDGYWLAYHGGPPDLPPDVEAARLDANGKPIDRGILAVNTWPSTRPAIIPYLAVYTRIVPGLEVPRVFTAPLADAPRPHAARR